MIIAEKKGQKDMRVTAYENALYDESATGFLRENDMAFVNEYVSEEDKKNIFFTKNDPFSSGREQLRPYMWTIDRDNDFIFKSVGLNQPEVPDRFVFQWKGELGAIMAEKEIVKEDSSSTKEGFILNVTWLPRVLYLPVAHASRKAEVQNYLTEAFRNYGAFYGQGPIHSVKVIWGTCATNVGGGGYVTL